MNGLLAGGRARLIAIAVVLGVAVVAAVLVWAPWSSSNDPNAVDFGDAQLLLQDSDNQRTPTTTGQLIEAFPLPIRQPAYVPDGYELANVTFFQAPPGLDRLTFANNLMARYQGPDSSGLSFSQRPGFGVGIADGPSEDVTVLGTQGQYIELDRAEGVQTLTWARCRRVFILDSFPLKALSKDDLVRIAESIGPEECE